MSGNWRRHLRNLGDAFITAAVSALLARLFLTGSLLAFFEERTGSAEVALTLATLLLGALLFGFFALIARLEMPYLGAGKGDLVRVRSGKGALYLDAASVCDQVFIATSKVQHVKCTEVDVHARGGKAYITIQVRVESAALLHAKHAELRAAIQEMAARLHIQLGAEPVVCAKLPPLQGGRTVQETPINPFGSIFRDLPMPPAQTQRPSIFDRRPLFGSPSSLDGEAPSRPPFGSIFGRFSRPNKPPEKPDDEQ